MTYQPFLIANMRTGLEKDMEPWLIPQDAFPVLEDAYMFRGRVKRKIGYHNLGRLKRDLVDQGLGDASGAGFAANIFSVLSLSGALVPGSLEITVGAITFSDNGDGTLTGSPSTNTGTINYQTGGLILDFDPSLGAPTPVTMTFSYYPLLPVMGLETREVTALTPQTQPIDAEQLIAFDTKYSYKFDNTLKAFVDINTYKAPGSGPFTWVGTDSDFFWSANYQGAFWATNFIPGLHSTTTSTTNGDGIRWYDGIAWANFNPPLDSSGTPSILQGALIVLPYKDRLLCLNTWEGEDYANRVNHPQRARWSQNGTPFYADPVPTNSSFQANAWFSGAGDIGLGGFIDAPTSEQIVSAQFIKDTLIVFFERSTWQLRYTGNELLPFVWEKINTELGARSTFSAVPFDKGVFAVGNLGIISSDSVNVSRIDQIIPDDVFGFENEHNGVKRVHGIRDYFNQLVYWCYPSSETNRTFPNQVLVLNYLDGSYSIFNDSFTTFGYYQSFNDLSFATISGTWEMAAFPWGSPQSQALFPSIVAGNQRGFVFQLNKRILNDPGLDIVNISVGSTTTLNIPNHNLLDDQFVQVNQTLGVTGLTGNPYKISVVDDNNILLLGATSSGSYLGGGSITLLNNVNITTKLFNPYIQEGQRARLGYVDFYFDRTEAGEVSVSLFVDDSSNVPIQSFVVRTRPEEGKPLQTTQQKIWHRMYTMSDAQEFQLQITMNDSQMQSSDINASDIVLQGLILWFTKSGRLV